MEVQYYLHNGTGQIGPLTLADIRASKPSGITHAWYAGAADWLPVDSMPEVKEALAAAPIETPTAIEPPSPPSPPTIIAAPLQQASPPPSTRVHSALADELDRLYRGTVTWYVLYFIALVVTTALSIIFIFDNDEEIGALVAGVGGLATLAFYIAHTVCWCKLHYRHWLVICERTGFKDHTPDQAVGFIFIPLFTLYWTFPSYQKLAELINHVIDSERFMGRGPRVNTGTTTAMCVLKLVSVVPYLGFLAAIVNIFVWFSVHAQNRTAIAWILRSGA